MMSRVCTGSKGRFSHPNIESGAPARICDKCQSKFDEEREAKERRIEEAKKRAAFAAGVAFLCRSAFLAVGVTMRFRAAFGSRHRLALPSSLFGSRRRHALSSSLSVSLLVDI